MFGCIRWYCFLPDTANRYVLLLAKTGTWKWLVFVQTSQVLQWISLVIQMKLLGMQFWSGHYQSKKNVQICTGLRFSPYPVPPTPTVNNITATQHQHQLWLLWTLAHVCMIHTLLELSTVLEQDRKWPVTSTMLTTVYNNINHTQDIIYCWIIIYLYGFAATTLASMAQIDPNNIISTSAYKLSSHGKRQ